MSHDDCRERVEALRNIAHDLYRVLIRFPCSCIRHCTCGWDAALVQYEQSILTTQSAPWPEPQPNTDDVARSVTRNPETEKK